MKRIIFISLLLTTCLLSPHAQKQKTQRKPQTTHHKPQATRQKSKTAQQKTRITQQPQRKTNQKVSRKRGKGSSKPQKYVTTEEIKGLQRQNQQIQKEITENEQKLKQKEKDVAERLQKIITLDTEIGQHQKTIDTIASDIKHLDGNIGILKGQLNSLETQLDERRARFIRSMRYMARHRGIQDKLMFIFSAKSLTQMYRRLRFVREYAAYQRAQGELLKAKQLQVDQKHNQLRQVRGTKSNLLYKDRQTHIQMENKKIEQQNVVQSLQNDQKVLQGVIADRQKKQQAITAQVDRLVAIEMEKVRQRAIAEAKAKAAARAAAAKQRAADMARKKAAAEAAARENARRIAEAKAREEKARAVAKAKAEAAERARREAAAKAEAARQATERARQQAAAEASAKKERELRKAQEREERARREEARISAQAAAAKARADQELREAEVNRQAAERKAVADRERAAREQAAAAKASAESTTLMSSADRAMTGSFANNRGRLPMPMSGRIITHYGNYNVNGLSHVKLNSSGINIKGSAGSPVRSVFKGEVSAIFSGGGTTAVMVRHGVYISSYFNMGSVSVRKGQTVGTGQTLGTVDSGGVLHFQLRKETAKLNPEQWLR